MRNYAKKKDETTFAKSIHDKINEKKISIKDLSAAANIPLSRMNEYLSDKRKPGVKVLNKIAKGLDIELKELEKDFSTLDDRPDKFKLMDIFLDSINQFQHQSTSLSQLSIEDYKKLLVFVSKLGGWKKVLTILHKEIYEAKKRDEIYNKQIFALLQDNDKL